MARFGFIHDKLDIKLLVLYIMDRVAAPIDFATLTDLSMCDSGMDYFQFAEAAAELADSGHLDHIAQDGEFYSITEKGRRTCAAGESSLSSVIRQRCDRRLAPLNQALKRKAQVRARVEEAPLGFAVCLSMDDDQGSLFSLSLLSPTKEDAQRIADHFLTHPDRVYNGLLGVLLTDNEGGAPQ